MKTTHYLLTSSVLVIVASFFVWTSGVANAITIANFPQGFTFTKDLSYGMTDPNVTRLQQVLNTNTATQVAASGAGSPGNETSYFGPLTEAAVVKFQQLYYNQILAPLGLTSGTGYVGPSTRAELNLIISSNTGSAICPAGYICTPNSTSQTSTYQPYYNNNTNAVIQPTVTLLANGQSSHISVPVNTSITLSWTSANAGYCSSNPNGLTNSPTSGVANYQVTQSTTLTMYCFGASGSTPGSASVTINAQSTTGTNSSSATTTNTATTGTNNTATQCPTGDVCTPNNQNSASSATTDTSSATTGSSDSTILSLPSFLTTSLDTSSTATTTPKTATSTAKTASTSIETLDDGTVTGVLPCTFNPGNFYVGLNIASSVAIVPKTKTASSTTATSTNTSSNASSTTATSTNTSSNTSSTTATSTKAKGNSLGDKHYIWVLGSSQLYNGSITITTIKATATSSSYTVISSTGSEVGGGFLLSLPPIGATLDMVIKKTNQSCSPQGGGYLIEKAYVRQ
jgi:hypothetical protein